MYKLVKKKLLHSLKNGSVIKRTASKQLSPYSKYETIVTEFFKIENITIVHEITRYTQTEKTKSIEIEITYNGSNIPIPIKNKIKLLELARFFADNVNVSLLV